MATQKQIIATHPAASIILAVYLLSGMSTLIYQVVWMRMLSQVFGSTVYAVATIVTVFMAGLAIGSLFAGRWVDGYACGGNLLRRYALIEAGIGAYCLLTPWLFTHLDGLYAVLYRELTSDFMLFSLLRLLFSFVVLLLPTALMGATLPVISRFYARQDSGLGGRVGWLYGVNTLGAVVGVLLTAFLLIPVLGMQGSLLSAVAINMLIAALSYGLSRHQLPLVTLEQPPPAASVIDTRSDQRVPRYAVLVVFALSGFTALAYEVVWFRMLGLIIGNSVYAFAVMLAVYLLGIALGSALLAHYVDRLRDRVLVLVWIEVIIGASVILMTPLFGRLPVLFMGLVDHIGAGFAAVQMTNVLTALVVMLIPTLLFGMTFPLVVRLAGGGVARLGRSIGALYAVNTLGGVAGSLAAGFVLIPLLGMQISANLVALLNILIGAGLLFVVRGYALRLRVGVLAIGVVALSMALIAEPWAKHLLTSGVYFNAINYRGLYQQGRFEEVMANERQLVFYKEGLTGTVSVRQLGAHFDLAINGKITAAVPENTFTNIMLGSVPLLLHEQPRTALLIGLASGVTLDAMIRFPLDDIDVVEIAPEVVEANALFATYNHHALDDERVKLLINDARTHLAYSRQRYDVIAYMLPVPLSSGVANLFTYEFFKRVAQGLNPGGIACQWLPSYGLEQRELDAVIRSYQQAFRYVSIWQYDVDNMLLLGSDRPLVIDYPQMAARLALPAVSHLMTDYSITTVEAVVGGLVLDDAALRELVGDGRSNTDNDPLLEFAVPRNLFKATAVANYNRLVRFRPVEHLGVKFNPAAAGADTGTVLSFLGISSALSSQWQLQQAGFNIRNRELVVTPSGQRPPLSKGVMPLAEWRHAGDNRWLQLRNMPPLGSAEAQADRVSGLINGRLLASGQGEIDGQLVHWVLKREQATTRLALAWQCRQNGRAYAAELVNAPDAVTEVKSVLEELDQAFNCLSINGPMLQRQDRRDG